MLKNTCCSICLSINKRTTNVYRTDLQYVYENLANFKISNECWMCYICHTRLRQCHQLQQLAVQTRGLIDDIFQKKMDIKFGAFESLLELSTSKTKITSTYIKQELDGETEFHSDGGIEQDEIVVNTNDYEVEEKPSMDDLAQESPNVLKNDTLQNSKAHKLKLVKLSQTVNVEYAPQNQTSSVTDLEGRRGQSCGEQSTYNAEIKQEIEEEVEDKGIDHYDERDNTNDCEGRDHASEAQADLYKDPLSCDVCLKNFACKSKLLDHVRTHTGIEQDEILVNTIDYEVEGKPSEESEDAAQELPNVLKNYEKSKDHKIKLVKLNQILNVEYAPQNPTTSTVTEDLEGKGEHSKYNAEIKQEIEEEVGDKGIDHYDDRDDTDDCEERDHASEAEAGRYKKTHTCDVCLKQFPYKSKLIIHIRTHTGEMPYGCDICSKKFSRKVGLNNHHKLIHKGEKSFSCDICSKKFSQSGDVTRHIKVIHYGDKPFSCDVCTRKFARKSYLDRHMLSHTGDQPFCCDVCSKKFTFKINLDTHMKIHNDKTYICYICGKKFAVKRYLKIHLLSHAGVKPFSCDICSKKFTQKSSLNTHKQVHNKPKTIVMPTLFVKRNS